MKIKIDEQQQQQQQQDQQQKQEKERLEEDKGRRRRTRWEWKCVIFGGGGGGKRRGGMCVLQGALAEDNARFILLAIVLLAYMLAGAALFQFLESDLEVQQVRISLIYSHWCFNF